MTARNNNEKSATGNDGADGMAGRTPSVPRRVSSCPLPPAPGVLTDTQKDLIRAVIALAEAADLAEATRARRLPHSEFNTCRAPDFGSDVSDYVPTPETRQLTAFINEQYLEERTILVGATIAGRENLLLTTSNIDWLLSCAATAAEHAGSYMTCKTHLTRYLREGLRKFESFAASMSRRR